MIATAITFAQLVLGQSPDAVQQIALLTVFALILTRQLLTLLHNSTLTAQLRPSPSTTR